jgi:hypothetical protein
VVSRCIEPVDEEKRDVFGVEPPLSGNESDKSGDPGVKHSSSTFVCGGPKRFSNEGMTSSA